MNTRLLLLGILAFAACETPPAPAVCSIDDCAMGARCDTMSGQCVSGCDQPSDCRADQLCNPQGQCVCASGTHDCSGACVSNDAVATCGSRCEACPDDANGTATCSQGACGLSCSPTALLCNSTCASCPAGATTKQCSGSQCAATTCESGRMLCGGKCPSCPAGSATTGCGGNDECIALTCQSGRRLCDSQCAQCPAGATATHCDGAACVADTCAAGRLSCGGLCPSCPSGAATTTCSGATCVATTCSSGFMMCKGSCISCPAGKLFCCKESVDTAAGLGPDHALALDSTDQPVIAYRDDTAMSLKVARRNTSGTFTTTTIDSTADVGTNVSVAVDAAGVAHVSYVRESPPYAVKYARVPVSGSATIETVESNLLETGATSIAVDIQGGLHIGYYASGDAHYAYKATGGGWQSRIAMNNGRGASLALYGLTPHLVGSSNPPIGVTAIQLSYGVLDAGATAFSLGPQVNFTLGSAVPHDAALKVTADGAPVVSWADPQWRDLRVSQLDGGAWETLRLTDGDFVSSTSLALSSNGAHIAYHAFVSGTFTMRYAEPSSTGYRFMTIDSSLPASGTPSLVLDSAGRPHVTLWNPVAGQIFYLH